MFDRIRNQERETHSDSVLQMLTPCCIEIKQSPPRAEQEIMNMACLILHGKQAEFENAVQRAAKLFDDNFIFHFNGPWAPHNFAQMEI
jgi:hypothetical protein